MKRFIVAATVFSLAMGLSAWAQEDDFDLDAMLGDFDEPAAETVEALLGDEQRLKRMRDSCRRFVRKNSCEHIYRLAKKLAEAKE